MEKSLFNGYAPETFFDEMMSDTGAIRPHYRKLAERFGGFTPEEFEQRRRAVDLSFLRQGITFNVYGDSQGVEKIFPFDLVPRLVPATEGEGIEAGQIGREA